MNSSASGVKREPVLTVGLLWHSTSSDNLGVGALTLSQIAICSEVAAGLNWQVRFIVFGTKGTKAYAPPGVDVRQGSHISLKQIAQGRSPFASEVRSCDLVLDIGEGDSFADIYGWRRFLFQAVTKFVVLRTGRPLVLSPQTIGPFNGALARRCAAWLMARAAVVFARDGLSMQYLAHQGLATNARQVVDVAFRLPYLPAQTSLQEPRRIQVGMNVSGLLYSGGYSSSTANQFALAADYVSLTERLIQYWLDREDVDLWLIPHVLSDLVPRDDDRVAMHRLLAQYPRLRRAPDFATPSEAKSFMSGLDFMTGARMHACIGAFSAGVPTVPIAYSRKFTGLFQSLGYDRIADATRDSTDRCFDMVIDAFEKRAALCPSIESANRQAASLLDEYASALRALFKARQVS